MATKQYDFSELDIFFHQFMSPQEICQDLIELVFNYISLIDESNMNLVKNDISTIYLLYSEINKVKIIDSSTNSASGLTTH